MIGRKNEYGKLEILGVGKSKSLGVHRGVVNNITQTIQSIQTAVAEAEENSGYMIKDVVVGIAGQHIRSIEIHVNFWIFLLQHIRFETFRNNHYCSCFCFDDLIFQNRWFFYIIQYFQRLIILSHVNNLVRQRSLVMINHNHRNICHFSLFVGKT